MTESSDTSDTPAKPQDYAGLRAELATLVDDFSPLINELWPRLEDHKYRWELHSYGLPEGYDKLVVADIIVLEQCLKSVDRLGKGRTFPGDRMKVPSKTGVATLVGTSCGARAPSARGARQDWLGFLQRGGGGFLVASFDRPFHFPRTATCAAAWHLIGIGAADGLAGCLLRRFGIGHGSGPKR